MTISYDALSLTNSITALAALAEQCMSGCHSEHQTGRDTPTNPTLEEFDVSAPSAYTDLQPNRALCGIPTTRL
jgi:hypothetical protein